MAEFYSGNQRLKGLNSNIEWTDELREEWLRCAEDPIYFAETYLRIVTEDGVVPFKLRDYQKEMLTSFTDNRFNIALCARQSGKTETARAFICHYILFNEQKTVALLANKGEVAREILGKIQDMYQQLPLWLQQGVGIFNKGSFALENGSRVIAAATSSSGIRGFTAHVLYIDECAFVEKFEDFYTSVMPTISEGKVTKIILVSTPNGMNHFYKFWKESEEGKNDFKRFYVPWNRVPGRDEKWKQDMLRQMSNDVERFNQEFEVEFLGSSGTLIAGWKLKQLSPRTPIQEHDGLYQYVAPVKDHRYVLVADVSRGKGLDYSAFQLVDVTVVPYVQACTYRSNMVTPIDYADVIYRMAKTYNDAAVMVEINDIGEQVGHSLHFDFEYDNVVFTESAGRVGKRITTGFGKNVDKGIRTTKNVKALGCSIIKLLIEQDGLVVNDFYTVEELSTFSRKGVSYEAEEGKHDDLVMGLVLFAWMTEQQYFKDLTDINTLNLLREKTEEEMMNDLTPFGWVLDGGPETDPLEVEGSGWTF